MINRVKNSPTPSVFHNGIHMFVLHSHKCVIDRKYVITFHMYTA